IPWYGAGTKPTSDPMFTIRPDRWSRIKRSTAWVIRKTPKKLVSNSCFASSIVVSSSEPIRVYPALLTRASIRPARSRTVRTQEWTDSSSRTSTWTSSTFSRAFFTPPFPLAVPKTRKPWRESRPAMARPIPEETPVTRATFSLLIFFSPMLGNSVRGRSPFLIDQLDFDGLFRSVQRKFRLVERRRTPFLRGVVGSAVALFGHSHKVLVHLSVAVFVVKDRDSEGAQGKILERYLGAHGLGIDVDTLLADGLRRVIGKTLGVLKQGYADLAFGVSRAGDAYR